MTIKRFILKKEHSVESFVCLLILNFFFFFSFLWWGEIKHVSDGKAKITDCNQRTFLTLYSDQYRFCNGISDSDSVNDFVFINFLCW